IDVSDEETLSVLGPASAGMDANRSFRHRERNQCSHGIMQAIAPKSRSTVSLSHLLVFGFFGAESTISVSLSWRGGRLRAGLTGRTRRALRVSFYGLAGRPH